MLVKFNTPFKILMEKLPFGISSVPKVERKMYETIEDLSGVEIIAANFLIIEYGKIVDGLNNHDENQIKFLRHRKNS